MLTRSAHIVRLTGALLLCALGTSSGGDSSAAAEPVASDSAASTPRAACQKSSVVLLTLDGVRWQEVFGGVDAAQAQAHGLAAHERLSAERLMPNLHRLIALDGAALGAGPDQAAIHASGPNFVSLPGYIELLTGRTHTGCGGNDCGRVRTATLFDELAADGCGTAALFSSWPGIELAASMLDGGVQSSAGRHGGAHREQLEANAAVAKAFAAGARASAEPGDGDFRPDAYTGEAALAFLQAAHPRFLFIGLGDTDEYGHADDYRSYLDAMRRADALIGRVAQVVFQEMALGHPTTLFISTDHGRADGFAQHGGEYAESSRTWLVAAGSGIVARGPVAASQVRHIADVAPTIRHLLGLPAVATPDAGHVLTELLVAQAQALTSAWRPTQELLAGSELTAGRQR